MLSGRMEIIMRKTLSIIMATLMLICVASNVALASDIIVLPEATISEHYLQHIIDIEDNYPACEITQGSLPNGITLSYELSENETSGYWFLEGEATELGTFVFEVKMTYKDSTDQKMFELTVNDNIVLEPVEVFSNYEKRLEDIVDGYPKCEISDGALPVGLSLCSELDEDGKTGNWLLMGNLQEIGTFTFETKLTYADRTEYKHYLLSVSDIAYLESDAYQIYEDFDNGADGWSMTEGWQIVTDASQAHIGDNYIVSASENELTSPTVLTTRENTVLTWYDCGDAGEKYSVYLTKESGERILVGSYEARSMWTPHKYTLDCKENVTITFKHEGTGTLALDLVTVSKGYDKFGGVLKNAVTGYFYTTELYNSNAKADIKFYGNIPNEVSISEYTEDYINYAYNLEGTFESRGDYEFYVEFTLPSGRTEIVKYIVGVHDLTVGDVTEDSVVNTSDAVMILKHAADIVKLSESQIDAADTTKDETVNTADAVLILKYAAGMISEF